MEHNQLVQEENLRYEGQRVFGQKRPQTYKSFTHILLISSMYYVSFIYFGYIMMYFNSIDFSEIMKIFNITLSKNTAEGIFSGTPSLGACIGAFGSKFLIKRFSRNKNFIYCNVLAIVAGILVLIPNMVCLFLGRLIQGACVGFFCSITPLTIKQFSPIQIAGTMNGINNVAIAIGYFLGYFCGWVSGFVFDDHSYRYIFVFSITFFISYLQLFWLIVIFPYQTPKYLIEQNKIEEAKQVIKILYKQMYQQKILKQKMLQHQVRVQNQINKKDNQLKVNHQTQSIGEPPQNLSFKNNQNQKRVKFALVTCIYLMVAQQMTGFNVLLIYAPEITKSFLPSLGGYFPLIIDFEKLVVTFLATFFLFDRFGRKRLLVIGYSICALSLYSLVYGVYKIRFSQKDGAEYIFFGIIFCIFSISASLGPLSWVYISEVMQPDKLSYVVFMKWMTNFIAVATFPILRGMCQNQDAAQIFLTYFIFTLITAIILQYMLVQTKDKNEIQISQQIRMKELGFERYFCQCAWFQRFQYRIHTHWNQNN